MSWPWSWGSAVMSAWITPFVCGVLWPEAGIVGCVGLQDQEPTEREVVGFSPVIYGEVQHILNHHAAGRDVSFAVLVGHR